MTLFLSGQGEGAGVGKTNKWGTEGACSLFSRSVCCYRRPANAKTVVMFDKIGCLERSRKFNSHVTTSGLNPRRKLINGLKHTNQRFWMIAFLNVSALNIPIISLPPVMGFLWSCDQAHYHVFMHLALWWWLCSAFTRLLKPPHPSHTLTLPS